MQKREYSFAAWQEQIETAVNKLQTGGPYFGGFVFCCFASLQYKIDNMSTPPPLPYLSPVNQGTLTGMLVSLVVGLGVSHSLLRHGSSLVQLVVGDNAAGKVPCRVYNPCIRIPSVSVIGIYIYIFRICNPHIYVLPAKYPVVPVVCTSIFVYRM